MGEKISDRAICPPAIESIFPEKDIVPFKRQGRYALNPNPSLAEQFVIIAA